MSKSNSLVKKVKPILIIVDDDEPNENFVPQLTRKNVLQNILTNMYITGKEIFKLIMSDNSVGVSSGDETRQGWLFETLCIILIVSKCIAGLNYTEILDGQLQNLKQVFNFNNLLKIKVAGGGNNKSDMTLKDGPTLCSFTIKYKNKFGETDVSKIDSTITSQHITDYKIGLFVKDKEKIIKHKYNNKQNIDKLLHDKIIENGLLFDESDIINALDVFRQRFNGNTDFIEHINTEYLFSPRQQLILKLHQAMTIRKFINSISSSISSSSSSISSSIWCIAHKPRSGKSITILLICKFLLANGYKKILIMTPVPDTINSFVKDLEKYIDFKSIEYKIQDNADELDIMDEGIVFCSVQFLKSDKNGKKKELLKKIGFDAIITDESHQGASTDKTKKEILDVTTSITSSLSPLDEDIMTDIQKHTRLNIFASGTSEKTKRFYKIRKSCISEWELEDEAFMKELAKSTDEQVIQEIKEIMSYRHGPEFLECLEDKTLNQDYSKHPVQILMKHSISELLINDIIVYNAKNGKNYGYSCKSLLALRQIIGENGEPTYSEEFELCNSTDGIDILKSFFESIISKNMMNPNTIMKQVEKTQSVHGSRKSTTDTPLLFLLYLPTHTGNNTIALLQKTLKTFLEAHSLWDNYNIAYSNSSDDSGDEKEEYNKYIETIMNKTKQENKRGCILLLGNKGGVGITYPDCDVTIHLDDGHNLANQQQRMSRALTETEGKTIGINVDMNIQRTYHYLLDIIQRHRKNIRTTKTNAEILYYLYEHNVFLFDPQQINNGLMTTTEIKSYFETVSENMMKQIDDSQILEELVCEDDMRDILTQMIVENKMQQKKVNKSLEGEQPNCPKGGKTPIQIDGPKGEENGEGEGEGEGGEGRGGEGDGEGGEEEGEGEEDELNEIEKLLINKTLELSKKILPYLSIISKSYKIFDFKEILIHEKTIHLIRSFLECKKIEVKEDNYSIIVNIMNKIIDNNAEIVNNIREIYRKAPAHKLRELIEKHFIPTYDEKKRNAEIPTPTSLVDYMLNLIPVEFWTMPQKVIEPCCGKGNFVLGIFDRFYKGLAIMYPDNIERCQVIMTECIYYADLTALNVFITTEILKCHVQSYCGLDELEFKFNNYIGDTLQLNIEEHFGISGFNAAIGNPPYNDDSGNKGKGHTVWTKFIEKSLQSWLLVDGYLLFVNPSLWRQPEHPLQQLMKSRQIVYLEIHDEKDGLKTFNCNTRYDIYLIKNTKYETTTIIKTQKGEIEHIDLREWAFIPNYDFNIIGKIIKGTDKIDIIHSESKYEVRRPHMSHIKSELNKYPCIYAINRSNELSFKWSATTDNGMFNIPKVVFASGATGFIVDKDGEYGLTQWATGIVDDVENLEHIKNVLSSNKFKDIILATSVSKAEINRKILKYFKKDFWREFV